MPTPEAHFATFPLELPELCIKASTGPGDTVLDPFAGAGTTWLACLKHGREFVGIELNTEYIEIAENRARKHYPLMVGDI
jgi:DNA modification methylase